MSIHMDLHYPFLQLHNILLHEFIMKSFNALISQFQFTLGLPVKVSNYPAVNA